METDILERAICFAAAAHAGAKRKGSDTPYILHPLEAAAIAGTMTSVPEILAAAVLHDVVEDTPVTAEELRTAFGDRVAELVAGGTENKRRDRPAAETWRARKEEALETLRQNADRTEKILCLSDKLSNLRAIRRDQLRLGDAVFDRFNCKDPAAHRWYYTSVAALLTELAETPAYREFTELLHAVFDRYA